MIRRPRRDTSWGKKSSQDRRIAAQSRPKSLSGLWKAARRGAEWGEDGPRLAPPHGPQALSQFLDVAELLLTKIEQAVR